MTSLLDEIGQSKPVDQVTQMRAIRMGGRWEVTLVTSDIAVTYRAPTLHLAVSGALLQLRLELEHDA